MKHQRTAATLILLGLAFPSFALTIGRPQGAAWIGKPLDLVIPLTLGDSESGNALCLEGDVVQGDTRIDDKRVTLSLEPGASANAPRLHVRSTVPIEEPVVNVTVRAGCDSRSNRTFVLLADVPVETASLPSTSRFAATPLPSAGSSMDSAGGERSGRASRGVGGSGSGSGAGSSAPVRRAPPPRPRAEDAGEAPVPAARPSRRIIAAQAPVVRPAPPPARPPAVAAPALLVAPPPAPAARVEAPPAGPRLKIEALEPALSREGSLKTSSQLALPATEDLAKRAQAAAQWRALAAPPEDAQRESQRIQTLEATLAALREQTAQNQRALLEMRSELADARESRYRNPLVYALVGLLALALLAIGLLWRLSRRATAPAWWGEGTEPRPVSGGGKTVLPADSKFDEEDDDEHEPTQRAPLGGRELDPRHVALLAATNADTTYGPTGVPVVAPIEVAATRPVNTEELFDVQQQSDFFLSLGQHDQAIAVLVEHIAANPGTSALAYLDLFKIYHALGRREEYAQLATDFERAFNAEVPEFDEFSLGGRGLEHYRSALARIESQWPTAGTLALIEELVFRKPGVHEDEAFDLAAYQELLLLYAIAKEVVDPDTAPAPITPIPFVDTFSHDMQPTARATLTTEPTVMMPVASAPVAPAVTAPRPPVEPFPSIYGGIDDGLLAETEMSPVEPSQLEPAVDMDLAQFDKTAFETLAAPIEPAATAPAPTDPHVIDFELFDPETEAAIAPRIIKR
ncbi:hypothetical protein WKW80_12855 [Variovorax humicola]|uniref:Tetratricopeptide repeat protein n=1 Tax=Variovorax humicola TaxID=1769758 RepID=A0ABU8VYL3_9BURK